MKTATLVALFWLLALRISATHLMGGYIQVQKTASSALAFEYTVFLFLNAAEGADATLQQQAVLLCFGDGTTGQANRISQEPLEQNRTITVNRYRIVHTYAGPGTYTASATISNRTAVRNLTDGANVAFFTATTFSAGLPNSTPVVQIPANGFKTTANQRTTFNLQASDADGDSLVYSLAYPFTTKGTADACTQGSLPIYPFQFPNDITRRGTFKLNSRTGDLEWDAPTEVGKFTFAMSIEEWRSGTKIGTTLYEMILTVEDRNVQPGTIPPYEPAFTGPVITGLVPTYMEDGVQVTVYPNPATDRVQVHINSRQTSAVKLQLMNSKGSIMSECKLLAAESNQIQEFVLSDLPTGLYLLRTEIEGRTYTRKIVKR